MVSTEKFELDNVIDEIGQFGKFQLINYILISIPLGITAFYTVAYVFTASDLNYRCAVPECDQLTTADSTVEYNPLWLRYAVPYDDDLPEQCIRYSSNNSSDHECTAESFDSSKTERCHEFIFENDEKTILNEVRIIFTIVKWVGGYTVGSCGPLIFFN